MPDTFVTNVRRFIQQVSAPCGMPRVFNPWAERCELMDRADSADAPAGRRDRLFRHLARPNIRLILCGEAPGYMGCRFSGVPFSSERLMHEGIIPNMPTPMPRITHRPLPFSEPSATIVWGALYSNRMENNVILWNAYPWHPMGDGPLTNRTPTRTELEQGLPILQNLIKLYPDAAVVAVGGKAAASLQSLGVTVTATVRHPARGGATEFRNGLQKLGASHGIART